MVDTRYRVEGIRELRTALREVDGGVKELRKANRSVAKEAEARSRSDAHSGTRQQAAAAKAILGAGLATEAVLKIRNLAGVPFGIGAFMGALAWKQFPPWVGNSWTLGNPGEGPYVIRDVFARDGDEILDPYLEELADLFTRAGLPPEQLSRL